MEDQGWNMPIASVTPKPEQSLLSWIGPEQSEALAKVNACRAFGVSSDLSCACLLPSQSDPKMNAERQNEEFSNPNRRNKGTTQAGIDNKKLTSASEHEILAFFG